MKVIQVSNLWKKYKEVEAVKGISFDVEKGTVFSLLGPNGAGKTTTVEILIGVRKRTSGEVKVLGEDPERFSKETKKKLAVVFQETAIFENLTPYEILKFFKKTYEGDSNIEEILKYLDLWNQRKTLAKHLSGGQRRKLLIGTILVHDPELIFLDEPTTSLDPASRRNIWRVIQDLKAKGKTIFLTTHYMEEAQELSDVVCIMNEGKIVTMGRVEEVIEKSGLKTIVTAKLNDEEIRIETTEPDKVTAELLKKGAEEIDIRKPNLEDVFLHYTGRKLK